MEPLHGILLGESVSETNYSNFPSPVSYIESGPTKYYVEVKTIDSDGGVVLDTQVNVFLDSKAKVARVRKVLTTKFVFPDLSTSHQS